MAAPAARGGVAIIGMSCMFPGAPNVDAYWRNILGKVDAVTDPPPEAWDADVYYDPDFADTDETYCKRGGYLGALASFDPLAYGIPPVAVGGEPDQWLALQLAYDALGRRRLRRRSADEVRAAHGDRARQGHLPQRRQRDRRPARARHRPDARRSCGSSHPEYTRRELEILRDEMQGGAAAASAPRPSRG